MEDKKVSIAIPIYNVENYLDRCVKSIVNQTYKNLEIILVDDGSTDGCGKICDEWVKKDNRIKVVHKSNGGLSSARNAGLANATGDYIMFEDSDDWIEAELVERCVKRIENDKSDIVIFGYRKVDEQGKTMWDFTFGNETYSKNEIIEDLHKRILEMSYGYAWNKLYDLKFLKESGLEFDSSIIDREDLVFNMQLLSHIRKISYLEYVGYNYLQRNTSLLHNSNLARLKNINTFCDKMCEIKFENEEVERTVRSMCILHYLADCIIKNILWNEELNKKEKIKWINELIENYPYRDKLVEDYSNPKHLKMLYKSIITGNVRHFYIYVWLSDIKKKVMR